MGQCTCAISTADGGIGDNESSYAVKFQYSRVGVTFSNFSGHWKGTSSKDLIGVGNVVVRVTTSDDAGSCLDAQESCESGCLPCF